MKKTITVHIKEKGLRSYQNRRNKSAIAPNLDLPEEQQKRIKLGIRTKKFFSNLYDSITGNGRFWLTFNTCFCRKQRSQEQHLMGKNISVASQLGVAIMKSIIYMKEINTSQRPPLLLSVLSCCLLLICSTNK